MRIVKIRWSCLRHHEHRWKLSAWFCIKLLGALLCASLLQATPTNIVDVLLQPSGNPQTAVAGMDITISQTAFVSGNNYYPGFTLTPHPVSDSAGNVNLWLEPNITGQPYTVLFRATNGVITRECWNVPTSGSPLRIKDVRSTLCAPAANVSAAWGQISGIGAGLGAGAYSVYMPNPTYPPAYVIHSALSGDVDLYTVPTNRKALLLGWVSTNNGPFGGGINTYLETKIGGSYYRVTNTLNNGAPGEDGAFNVGLPNIVLSAGETLAVNSDNSGESTWVHLVEFDATSPLRSIKLTAFSAGDNVFYTVPAGKTFEVLANYGGISNATILRAGIFFSNGSGSGRSLQVFAVPSGGATSIYNRIANTGGPYLANGTVTQAAYLYGSLAPGDFVVVNVDANTPRQMTWMNIIEH